MLDLEARYGQALAGFVLRLGLGEEQAADCVQETMLRLWAELQRGTPIGDPKGWAFRTIYRVAIDSIASVAARWAVVERLGRRPSVGSGSRDEDDRIAVWTEIARLPRRQREVLYLRYQTDLSFEAIGEVLGVTAVAARSHASQATATLRRRLVGATGELDG